MPYVQTSLTQEEVATLHYTAKIAGKSIQRLVYEYIIDGLEKTKEKDNERGKTSKEAGKRN
jgi:hypothetical protein